MGFMNSYKRLDNLCRDMNGVGVTGYIEDMKREPNGAYAVHGWKDDYRNLKHYRYIRNQIAHDNYADEDNMCTYEDEEWIDCFYQRIMTQSDPLALYYASTKPRMSGNPRPADKPETLPPPQRHQYISEYTHEKKPSRRPMGCGITALCVIATVIAATLILFT